MHYCCVELIGIFRAKRLRIQKTISGYEKRYVLRFLAFFDIFKSCKNKIGIIFKIKTFFIIPGQIVCRKNLIFFGWGLISNNTPGKTPRVKVNFLDIF